MEGIFPGVYRLSGTGIVECLEITDAECNLKEFDGLTWLTLTAYITTDILRSALVVKKTIVSTVGDLMLTWYNCCGACGGDRGAATVRRECVVWLDISASVLATGRQTTATATDTSPSGALRRTYQCCCAWKESGVPLWAVIQIIKCFHFGAICSVSWTFLVTACLLIKLQHSITMCHSQQVCKIYDIRHWP